MNKAPDCCLAPGVHRTGTFGDMDCHIYDPVFKALALTAPLSVRSDDAAPNAHSWATDAICDYLFPGTAYTEGKTVRVVWYDGDQRPPKEILDAAQFVPGEKGRSMSDQGSIFLGTVATRFPKQTLEWDALALRFTNSAEATAFVKRTYRKGWDMFVAEDFRRLGFSMMLEPSIRAEHRCREVLAWCDRHRCSPASPG